MTIEEAKAKLSKAYYLIEEVSDAIGLDLTGNSADVDMVCKELNNAILTLELPKEDIELLKENDHD